MSRFPTEAVAGDQDATAGVPLTVAFLADENPVMQQLDRQHQRVIRRQTRRTTIIPTTTPTVAATWSTRTAPYSSM